MHTYGQCFLINPHMLNKIATVANLNNRSIIEIGPGSGNLTRYLLAQEPAILHMYEIDIRFIAPLKALCAEEAPMVPYTITHTDCLLQTFNTDIIISNLPYNISTEFCKQLILKHTCNEAVLLLQYEFAQKICDIYNILGFMFSVISDIRMVRHVTRDCFSPKPSVDSCIVHIVFKSHTYDKLKLWTFLSKLFSMHRKKIGKQFKKYIDLRPAQLTHEQILELYEINS